MTPVSLRSMADQALDEYDRALVYAAEERISLRAEIERLTGQVDELTAALAEIRTRNRRS